MIMKEQKEILLEEIISMDKIIHIDEMRPEEFITFVNNFLNIKGEKVEISEKIDGQNVSFGLDKNNKFFTKTKRSKPVFDPSFYGELDFMAGFKKFHSAFSKTATKLKAIKKEIQKKDKEIKDDFDLQIFGELLPSSQTNVLKYEQEKIGTGALILFDIKIMSKSILNKSYSKSIFDKLEKLLNNVGGWKVYFKKIINPKSFKFNVRHILTLEKLYEKYFEVIKSRKKADKEIKAKAKKVIQMVMDNIKKQFVKQMLDNRKSMLGKIKPEGLIIRDFKDNFLVKLVDKDDFTEANKAMHGFNKTIQDINRIALSRIKKEIFNNADILKNFAKVIEKATDNFFVEKQKNPKYKYKSIDDILIVAYNDMIEESRITLTAKQAINKLVEIISEQLSKIKELEEEWKAFDKKDMSDTSKKVTNGSFKNTEKRIVDIINAFKKADTKNGAKIYISIISFVFGETKVKELKDHFKLTEGLISETGIQSGYPNKEDMKKIKQRVNKERNRTDSNEKYQYHPIKKYKELSEAVPVNIDLLFKNPKIKKLMNRLKIKGDTDRKSMIKLLNHLMTNPEILKHFKLTTEDIKLPVEIGDTVLMGKFKNKKIVVKTIDWNEKGDLLINGRPAMKMRLIKKPNIFDVKLEDIEEFLIRTDINRIIKESSSAAGVTVDDGPTFWFPKYRNFKQVGDKEAAKLGWVVVDYILGDKNERKESHPEYPDGPVKAVSFGPAGVFGQAGTEDLTGPEVIKKWQKHIKLLLRSLGWKILDFMKQEKNTIRKETEATEDAVEAERPDETSKKEGDEQHSEMKAIEEQLNINNEVNLLINDAIKFVK